MRECTPQKAATPLTEVRGVVGSTAWCSVSVGRPWHPPPERGPSRSSDPSETVLEVMRVSGMGRGHVVTLRCEQRAVGRRGRSPRAASSSCLATWPSVRSSSYSRPSRSGTHRRAPPKRVATRGARLSAAGRWPSPRPVLTLPNPLSEADGPSRTLPTGAAGMVVPAEANPPGLCRTLRLCLHLRRGQPEGCPWRRSLSAPRSEEQRDHVAGTRPPARPASGPCSRGSSRRPGVCHHRGGDEPDAWSGARCSCARGACLQGGRSRLCVRCTRRWAAVCSCRSRCVLRSTRQVIVGSAASPPAASAVALPRGPLRLPASGLSLPGEVSAESCRTPLMDGLKDCLSVDFCCPRPLPVLRHLPPKGRRCRGSEW